MHGGSPDVRIDNDTKEGFEPCKPPEEYSYLDCTTWKKFGYELLVH